MAFGGSAVGPPAGAGGPSAIRPVKLDKECELRIEVGPDTPLRLRLLTGTAEIFGTEIAPEIWLTFPPRLKFAVYTWYGATIELDGTTETDYTADETPMISYVNVHAVLEGRRNRAKASPNDSDSSQGPRVIVVGPTDSGKSTLSRMLLSWAAKQGWKPTFVDMDIGQGTITIPGCIAATPIEMPIDPVDGIPLEMPLVYFYGHTTPSVNADLYKVLVKELAQTLERQFAGNAESRAAGMVINTMGWIEGVGYELLLHAIDAFNANVVLVLGQEKLCSMLKDVLKSKPNVDVVSRNAKVRQKARSYRIRNWWWTTGPTFSPANWCRACCGPYTIGSCEYQPGFAPFGSCCFICQRTRPNYFKSFEDAWKATCSAREVSGFSPTMHVPDGYEFLLQPVIFSGPCNSEAVNVVIDGNLTAPSHPSKWKCDGSNCRQWIGFVEINGLFIYGSGTINAQGTKWWGSSDVNHNREYHGSKPTGFVIAHSNNVHISDLTFIDSPQMHMALERSTWVYVYNLTITAPGDSPNTDGIHIQHSTHVFISQTHIGTGDDCISIGDGSSYLNISMITCGPGHGISIGSLGIRGQYETVENVYVSNVEFRGTSNGARIKTWQGGSGFARNIVFEHIRSIGSTHPIIIDQYYCDHQHCKNQLSISYSMTMTLFLLGFFSFVLKNSNFLIFSQYITLT